ncbi:unnamed protein product [Ixodes persulcatus]
MFRNRGWFSGGLWKPKNPHSLEHLKYLYHLLSKNQTVTEQNKGVLVETLRSIAEILIWGDQNDSTVFDFFLEKNMLSFFLKFMKQKCGRYVCIQLLQTLNILFENIRNETSLYYLLSNNHVNSIIVHKFDFSDEEVMAYYISFLKTLSLKLNNHTIHFFYNEHTNDFPLYTEAIKFFNHTESMVRIAVRTLTLNVFKVEDKAMLKFIRDRTAAPYFSNLVYFIGKHVIELDTCVINAEHGSSTRLADLVAEHLDHLHYVNDILCLHIEALNAVLTDHLLHRLLVPLYVYSLVQGPHPCLPEDRKRVSSVVSLFLLSQVFLIVSHQPLVRQLANIILNRDMKVFAARSKDDSGSNKNLVDETHSVLKGGFTRGVQSDLGSEPEFLPPEESLEKSLETSSLGFCGATTYGAWSASLTGVFTATSKAVPRKRSLESGPSKAVPRKRSSKVVLKSGLVVACHDAGGGIAAEANAADACSVVGRSAAAYLPDGLNITDEQKAQAVHHRLNQVALEQLSQGWHLCDRCVMHLAFWLAGGKSSSVLHIEEATILNVANISFFSCRPFLGAILHALDCSENDHPALFALCLLYALGHNPGINEELLDTVLTPSVRPETRHWYNIALMEKLIQIISLSCKYGNKVRLATLEMSILLLKQLVTLDGGESCLQDVHLAGLEQAREESSLLLRNFYKSEEIFLDMFEDEFQEMKKKPLNVEYLMMDANLLLPPMGTPMTGIEFHKRLPCGEVERARRAIRVFLLLRELSLALTNEKETQLPLTNLASCVKVDDVLDLNNSDLIACTVVVSKESQKIRRFMVIDVAQLVLVEPDSKRLGWGVAKFVGFLQDIEVTGDKEDSRCLHITVLVHLIHLAYNWHEKCCQNVMSRHKNVNVNVEILMALIQKIEEKFQDIIEHMQELCTIKFLVKENIRPAEILRMWRAQYRKETSRTGVHEWCQWYGNGQQLMTNEPHECVHSTAVTHPSSLYTKETGAAKTRATVPELAWEILGKTDLARRLLAGIEIIRFLVFKAILLCESPYGASLPGLMPSQRHVMSGCHNIIASFDILSNLFHFDILNLKNFIKGALYGSSLLHANCVPPPPPPRSDLGESPTGECQKPCCMSETSFSEESRNEARSNGELKPPVRSPSEVELCLNEGDDQFDEESLNVGECAAAPKPKGAVHTI